MTFSGGQWREGWWVSVSVFDLTNLSNSTEGTSSVRVSWLINNCPGMVTFFPNVNSDAEACMSGWKATRLPSSTKGRKSYHRSWWVWPEFYSPLVRLLLAPVVRALDLLLESCKVGFYSFDSINAGNPYSLEIRLSLSEGLSSYLDSREGKPCRSRAGNLLPLEEITKSKSCSSKQCVLIFRQLQVKWTNSGREAISFLPNYMVIELGETE